MRPTARRKIARIDRRHRRIGDLAVPRRVLVLVAMQAAAADAQTGGALQRSRQRHVRRRGQRKPGGLQLQQAAGAGRLLRRDGRREHDGTEIQVLVDGHLVVGQRAHLEHALQRRLGLALLWRTAANVHDVDLLRETGAGRAVAIVRVLDAVEDAALPFGAPVMENIGIAEG